MENIAPSITEVRARAVCAPLSRPIRTAAGTIPSAPLVLIDVVTDHEVVGRAYIFGYTTVTLEPLVTLIAKLKDMVIGKPVAPVERMQDFDRTFRLLGRQGLLGMAISGLDMAFWDALGRVSGLPVCALLGGSEKPIPAYDSYGIIDPAHDLPLMERSRGSGFNAFKIKLGSSDLETDVDTVAAVREVIGPDARLMLDYNQTLTVPEAIRRSNRLSEFDIEWLEEPVPAEDLSGHAAVRTATRIPIQTGENWWFPEDVARAIRAQASDFAMLDLMKIGGITGWLRAAGQAEGASLPVSSHLFIEASAHVLAVTPTAHYLEFLDVASAITAEPSEIEDGALRPRGPGLGFDWDEEAVIRYSV
jgi:mandelate racemase